MDALADHLESLASLGTLESRGEFTLAQDQVWTRLRQGLSSGEGSLRFLLRWLHARQVASVAISATKTSLTVRAALRAETKLPAIGQGDELDLSGADIDLARAVVGAQMLEPMQLVLQVDTGERLYRRDFAQNPSWERHDSAGQPCLSAVYELGKPNAALADRWRLEIARRFRASPLDITWNGSPLSGAYTFSCPVLAWRNLRRERPALWPLRIQPPETAVASFQTARHPDADVALGLCMGPPPETPFELLRHGELLPLPQAQRELTGITGLIRAEDAPLDLQGDSVIWTESLQTLATSLKDEAVDIILQLYALSPPLSADKAEAAFLGVQSVLLHLLDHQRFTEGHLLASWLRQRVEGSAVLRGFRNGYTFDKLSALLAEPAGQPQTATRYRKEADQRVRELSANDRSVVDEALLIAARLEMRARRDQPVKLSGDLQGKLAQLGFREAQRSRYAESARAYGMLALAFPPGHDERKQHLEEAARIGALAGLATYGELLARET